MGLFGLFNKKKQAEDLSAYGPLEIEVTESLYSEKEELKINCKVLSGRVGVGEELIYHPSYGDKFAVTVTAMEQMMMDLTTAAEGAVLTMTLQGRLNRLTVSPTDRITR